MVGPEDGGIILKISELYDVEAVTLRIFPEFEKIYATKIGLCVLPGQYYFDTITFTDKDLAKIEHLTTIEKMNVLIGKLQNVFEGLADSCSEENKKCLKERGGKCGNDKRKI